MRWVKVALASMVVSAALGVTREAAADAVIYDSEALTEVPTRIVVHGLRELGDVIVVVYPYPCAVQGAFAALEAAVQAGSDAVLEGPEIEGRGYLVVRDGVPFASASDYEGPYNQCYFFGLPRAGFPERNGAIAALEGLSDGGRWKLFSRDPAVLRTGVPLAMAGLAPYGKTPSERLVSYEARMVEGRLRVEAVKWTWTGPGGKTREQDPRTLTPEGLYAVEPHADLSLVDEAPWFAGSLVKEAGASGQGEKASETGPEGQVETPVKTPASQAAAPATTPSSPAAAPVTAPSPPAVVPAAASTVAPAPQSVFQDMRWVYGMLCLLVAAGAGLLLRRGRAR